MKSIFYKKLIIASAIGLFFGVVQAYGSLLNLFLAQAPPIGVVRLIVPAIIVIVGIISSGIALAKSSFRSVRGIWLMIPFCLCVGYLYFYLNWPYETVISTSGHLWWRETATTLVFSPLKLFGMIVFGIICSGIAILVSGSGMALAKDHVQ